MSCSDLTSIRGHRDNNSSDGLTHCNVHSYHYRFINKSMATACFKRIIFLHVYLWVGLVATTTLNFSNSNLTEVPCSPMSSNVSELLLDDNNIEELPNDSFKNYHHLQNISLSRSNLRIIHDGVFDNITKLINLRLRSNNLIKLPADFGPSTSVLKSMDLWDAVKSSDTFSYPYFSAFTSLEYIDIGGAMTTNLQDSFYPPNIKRLVMNAYGMTEFPNLSSLTPNITLLSIRFHRLKIIPQEAIARLYMLEQFQLANNEIDNFPNFSHCKRLWEMFMSHNNISLIPRQHIEGLDNIKRLRLDDNVLANMTDISYLSTLEEFNISRNRISDMPEEFLMGLPNMKIFACAHNFLTFLPNISKFFPQIQRLHVQGNSLKTLPDLYYQSSLTILNVGENPYVCNQSLCWLRMLPWMRSSATMLQDRPLCVHPAVLADEEVLRSHPTSMHCYQGREFPIHFGYNERTWFPSQYKDRLFHVWRFPC